MCGHGRAEPKAGGASRACSGRGPGGERGGGGRGPGSATRGPRGGCVGGLPLLRGAGGCPGVPRGWARRWQGPGAGVVLPPRAAPSMGLCCGAGPAPGCRPAPQLPTKPAVLNPCPAPQLPKNPVRALKSPSCSSAPHKPSRALAPPDTPDHSRPLPCLVFVVSSRLLRCLRTPGAELCHPAGDGGRVGLAARPSWAHGDRGRVRELPRPWESPPESSAPECRLPRQAVWKSSFFIIF